METTATDRAERGLSRQARLVLAMMAAAAVVTIAVTLAVISAQSQWEFAAILGGVTAAGTAFIWRTSRKPAMHVPVAALLPAVIFALAVGEQLLLAERVLGVRLSNRLTLNAETARAVEAAAPNRHEAIEQYGDDPLFFRRVPGSTHVSAYDGGPEFEAIVDQLGYLNDVEGIGPVDDSKAGMFLAGDSLFQGVGMPGLATRLNKQLPVHAVSLAMGGYGPRQKVEAARIFAVPHRPQWVIIDFYSGNDATDAVEDSVCDRAGATFRCRFDAPFVGEALRLDPVLGAFGRFGDPDDLTRHLRQLRSSRLSLALGTEIVAWLRRALTSGGPRQQITDGVEAMALPGFSRFDVYPARQLDWVHKGLALAIRDYERLSAITMKERIGLALVYTPTAYEIYRHSLRSDLVIPRADDVSELQRRTLRKYATRHSMPFCDLTDGFRDAVRRGARGFFGPRDGTHWSEAGMTMAATLMTECIRALPAPR